jgi:hypothetical protein
MKRDVLDRDVFDIGRDEEYGGPKPSTAAERELSRRGRQLGQELFSLARVAYEGTGNTTSLDERFDNFEHILFQWCRAARAYVSEPGPRRRKAAERRSK